jgi:hypothetical protein
VNANPTRNAAIERRIKSIDKNQYFLKIFVWPDSFKQFLVVKSLVVRQGFEYNLVPMKAGEKVTLGSSSGAEPVQ